MGTSKHLKGYLNSLWDFRKLFMGNCDGFDLNDRRKRATQKYTSITNITECELVSKEYKFAEE